MLSLLTSRDEERRELVNFKDPFDSEKIKCIHMHFFKRTEKWSASVEFENGMTEGTQKFENKDFGGLIKEIETFIKAL